MNSQIKKLFSSVLLIIIFLVLQKTNVLKQVAVEEKDSYVVTENLQKKRDTGEKYVIGESGDYYTLVRAVDGDTLVVLDNDNQEKKVRLIGVNTPETVDPRRPVECFGKEASNFTKGLVSKSNKQARLVFDDSQQKYDKYGRLLAYVYLVYNDGKIEQELFLNRELIKQGYAYEYTYKTPHAFQSDFKSLEKDAREGKRGLWGKVCN